MIVQQNELSTENTDCSIQMCSQREQMETGIFTDINNFFFISGGIVSLQHSMHPVTGQTRSNTLPVFLNVTWFP